jgi:hypothetical protein
MKTKSVEPTTLSIRDENGNYSPEIQALIDQEIKNVMNTVFCRKTLLEFCAENYRNIWGTVRFGAQFGKRIAVFFSGNEAYPKVWQLNPHINTLNVPHAVYLNPTDFRSADELLTYLNQELDKYNVVEINEAELVEVQQ